jgi:hypothetical protein
MQCAGRAADDDHFAVVYFGSSSPACSRTMYSAYQSGQFGGRRVALPGCLEALEGTTELMATGIVGKGAADEHGIQELGATPDSVQRRVVLQGIWIHGFGAIQCLARREYTVRPTRQFVGFIFEQLESVQVVFRSRSYFRLPDSCHHPSLIVLSPSVADSQSVSDHCPDSSPHLSHFRQRGDRRGCKVARKPLWWLSRRGTGRSSIGGSSSDRNGIGGRGTGRSARVRGRYRQYDAMTFDGEDAVSDLGQSFNIDVGAAID